MNIDIEKTDEATENEIVNLIASSLNTRNEIFHLLKIQKQGRIIRERLDSTNFLSIICRKWITRDKSCKEF